MTCKTINLELRQRIHSLLKENPGGLTCHQISKTLNSNYLEIRRALITISREYPIYDEGSGNKTKYFLMEK
jgi:hypothetical protein